MTYLCDCPTVGENIYLKASTGLESRVSPYVAGWGDALKATTVNVTGVVLDGVGYGTATIKKPAGSIPVTIK